MQHSPLDGIHRRLGAKMVQFSGWEMPIAYGFGTLCEHMACRNDSAVFDVSHLGTVRLTGGDAFDRLQSEFTNDLAKIGPGRAQYTHLLDGSDASVTDDIIVWWIDEQTFDVMPNATNTDRVIEAIGGVETTSQRAVFAVQGPQARARLACVIPEIDTVGRFRVAAIEWNGVPLTIAGTGYTGEDGVEIAVPADAAISLWRSIADAGVVPAGLGARDTLRLEAALPLHGHELGPGITPLQAGLGWVVSWTKGPFRGRGALDAERQRGVTRIVRGIATEGRRPARDGCAVMSGDVQVGAVSSGNFSPLLNHGIALAFVDPTLAIGDTVSIDVRGSALPGTIVKTPFVAKH